MLFEYRQKKNVEQIRCNETYQEKTEGQVKMSSMRY